MDGLVNSSYSSPNGVPDPNIFYKSIFENNQDGILIASPAGKIFEANPTACHILGYSKEELAALEAVHILDPADPNLSAMFDKQARDGRIKGETVFIARDGKRVPVSVYTQSLYDKQIGTYLTINFQDISEQKAVEKALNNYIQEVEDLYNNAPCGYHSLDENGFYLRINDTELKWLGYTREEVVGRLNELDILTPDSKEIFKTVFPVFKERGWVTDLEIDFVRKDGTILNALLNATAIYDETGRYITNRAIIYDISNQKKVQQDLAESESRYRFLTETIIDVVIHVNNSGECLYVSPSSEAVMGYKPEELTGTIGFGLTHPEDLPKILNIFASASITNQRYEPVQIRFRHKAGHYLWIEVAGHAIYSEKTGNLEEFVTISRDISARKQYEESLELALVKEKEFGELKSRFVAMASHEFRTPLATIMAVTESMRNYRTRMSEEQIDGRLDKIIHQVSIMRSIMDDVLMLGRLQAGMVTYNPEQNNLVKLCAEIVEEFSSIPEFSGRIDFRWEDNAASTGFDPKIIRQVISNLISNALKYSAVKSKVTVEQSQISDQLLVRVIDQGRGIPLEDQKHLFESFYRASNVDDVSGTGLGLAIAKQGMDMHKGQIKVESTPGVGSTFTIALPVITPQS